MMHETLSFFSDVAKLKAVGRSFSRRGRTQQDEVEDEDDHEVEAAARGSNFMMRRIFFVATTSPSLSLYCLKAFKSQR